MSTKKKAQASQVAKRWRVVTAASLSLNAMVVVGVCLYFIIPALTPKGERAYTRFNNLVSHIEEVCKNSSTVDTMVKKSASYYDATGAKMNRVWQTFNCDVMQGNLDTPTSKDMYNKLLNERLKAEHLPPIDQIEKYRQ